MLDTDGLDAEHPRSPRARPLLGCLLAPLSGALTAGAGVVLLARAWIACDIGISGPASSFSLVIAFFPTWLVATAWWGGTFAALGSRSALAAAAAGLLGSLALLWALMAWKHSPGGYPVTVCAPDNVPPWWPGWLPL